MSCDKLNRRTFLKNSAAAAISLPFFVKASALGADGRPAASERIVMGCIGTGGMGTMDMQGFLSYPEVQIVAVCDVDRGHRNNAEYLVNQKYGNNNCVGYNDFRDLVTREDIDAVLNGTPDHWHTIPSIWAMRHGKDVYCEKPLTLTIKEGQEMRNAAARYGAVTQTGTWQRSIHKFQVANEIIKSGALGKIHRIEIGLPGSFTHGPQSVEPIPDGFDYDMWLGQAPWAPYNASRCHGMFRMTFDYSGGEICDWGAHYLDTAQCGGGYDDTAPVEIFGEGTFPTEGIWNTATSYAITYKYADGVEMWAHTQDRNPDNFFFGAKFYGEDGKWLAVSREQFMSNPVDLVKVAVKEDEMRELWVSGSHHGNFLECIRTRRETRTPFRATSRSIALAHLGNISMRLERPLRFDPDKEVFLNDAEANNMISRPMRSPWHL